MTLSVHRALISFDRNRINRNTLRATVNCQIKGPPVFVVTEEEGRSKGIIQTPFSNQVRIDEAYAQGNNVDLRDRHLDGIHFEKSFRFDWELISWKPTTLVYAATAHWYAFSFPMPTTNVSPQPVEAALPLPI